MPFGDVLHAAFRAAKQVAGVPVTYRRGSDSVTLSAVVGQTPVEREDGAGTTVRSVVRDYLIDAADLVLSGQHVTPQRGDRIEEASGHVYEVMPAISKSELPWRYSGPGRDVYRVHTRLIDKP